MRSLFSTLPGFSTSYRPDYPGQLVLQLLNLNTPLAGSFITLDSDGLRKRPLPQT